MLLFAIVLAIFGRACGGELLNFDDDEYITQNPQVLAGLTGDDLRWALSTTRAANWHPLTWMSLQLDAQLYGAQPFGFHLTNVLLHAGNAALLFLALNRMTQAIWPSALAAALFGLHPLHVESVAWVAERKDVLSTFFCMLALLAYSAYARKASAGHYLLFLTAFGLGLGAKPVLVTLPFALLLLDFWPLRRARLAGGGISLTWLFAEKLPLFVLAAASSAITIAAQAKVQAVNSLDSISWGMRLNNAVVSYTDYLAKMAWPRDLAAYYPHPRDQLPIGHVAIAAIVLVSITVMVLVLRRPYLVVGWLWYLGTLVPMIGLVQVGQQAMADRYTYLPLLGIFISLAWASADIAARRQWSWQLRAVAALFVLGLCGAASWVQIGFWQNSIALWEHDLAVAGASDMGHGSLGSALEQKGNLLEAIRHYREALRIKPTSAEAHNALGVALIRQGNRSEAADEFARAVALKPADSRAHNNLGRALAELGKPQEALPHFNEALRLDPGYAQARSNLGQMLVRQGKLQEASQQAWILATSAHVGSRQGAKALVLARQICEATRYRQPEFLDALAAAYAEVGDYPMAVSTIRQALAQADSRNPELVKELEARLNAYLTGRPWRTE